MISKGGHDGRQSTPPACGGARLSDMVLGPRAALAQSVLEAIPFDQKLVAAAPAADRFGATLAVAGDTLVVGASTANVSGRFFVGAADLFQRDTAAGIWGAPLRLLAADGAASTSSAAPGWRWPATRSSSGCRWRGARAASCSRGRSMSSRAMRAGGRLGAGGEADRRERRQHRALRGEHRARRRRPGGGRAAAGAATGRSRSSSAAAAARRLGRGGLDLDGDVGDGGLPLENFGGAVALEGDLLLVGASSADVSFSARTTARPTCSAATPYSPASGTS